MLADSEVARRLTAQPDAVFEEIMSQTRERSGVADTYLCRQSVCRTRSNAYANRYSDCSSNRRPISWSPIGRPSVLRPQGTERLGCPVKLVGAVHRVRHVPTSNFRPAR
jgi:hypothetical protein